MTLHVRIAMRPGGRKGARARTGVRRFGPSSLLRLVRAPLLRDAARALREIRRHGLETVRARAERRPLVRGDCAEVRRPCPWAGCRYHLGADVDEIGVLFEQKREIADPTASCALDVCEAHPRGLSLGEVGARMGLSRESARRIEAEALRKVRLRLGDDAWEAFLAGVEDGE